MEIECYSQSHGLILDYLLGGQTDASPRSVLEILDICLLRQEGDMPRSRTVGLTIGTTTIDMVIAQFGSEVTRKLRTGQGSKEDHLRGPFEHMLSAIADSLGLAITTIGETRLPDLSIRPDYAVDVAGARAGYVEPKKPGHGVPENWANPSKHDREQWEKFQLLPNVPLLRR